MSGQLLVLNEVDSTQIEARRRFEAGENGPLWVLARRQTAGRGRRARSWESPSGNLHLSLLFRPEVPLRRWPELSLLASLVAVKTIERLTVQAGRRDLREALALKWPNDVLLNGCKLGGILLETVQAVHGASGATPPLPDAPAPGHGDLRRALIIGWGLNLAAAPPPEQVRWPATALAETGLEVHPGLVFETLRDAFWRWYQVWQAHGVRNVHQAWRKRAFGLGGMIRLRHGGEELHGRYVNIDPSGALVLQLADGRQRVLHAGEVAGVEMNEGK